jgi:hypothetical protein
MSRLASYAAALAIGLVISACADRPADRIAPLPARTAAQEAPAVLCGDAARPCQLDAIVVSGERSADAAVAVRS